MQPFPISLSAPIVFPGPPPRAAEVVVIGGGIIGICTALYLAEAGHDVVLIEKGRIAAEQSSRNWGWIRQQGRDPDELPIMIEAAALWRDLARRTSVDIGLRQGGVTYLARRSRDMAGFERWIDVARAHGVESRLLSATEVRQQFEGLSGPIAGALTTPSDMRAEPWVAVPALAGLAAAAGVRIVENCAVRMLDIEAGRVAGVITEHGRVRASQVVLAGGAWSSLFLRNHGVDIPQLSVRESVAATSVLPQITPGAAADAKVSFRRRADGGYTLAPSGVAELYIGPGAFRALPYYVPQLRADPFGQSYLPLMPQDFPDGWRTLRRWSADQVTPFERMRILSPDPNTRHLKILARRFAQMFPNLPPFTLRASWAGMIDTMPDIVPIVDHCAALPGLVIGTGMSGHGFGIGPGMGRILAALVTGARVGHDLARFRGNRFRDGSAVRLPPSF